MSGVVVHGIENLPQDARPSAVTIGKFDGVHRGHRAVLDHLITEAEGRRTVAVTFDRHPAAVLHPESAPETLLSTAQKTEALIEAGVDLVVVLPFTPAFAALTPEQFVDQVLVHGLHAERVLVGSDFRYGARGAGTLLESGRLDEATEALGRPHRIRSLVVPGHQRGRELGYPTANLARDAEGCIPADGVYACWLHVEGARYGAAVSIGNNPTFGDVPEKTVEAHAIDVHLDLYGKTVELEFVAYIRSMHKFDSADALAEQMGRDELRIRGVLGLASPAAGS